MITCSKPYKIYAEVLEEEALKQFESAMNCDFAVKGALMPDAHAGYSLPIGAVVATKDVIVPSWIGFDVGCGMCAVKTSYNINAIRENADKIFKNIYRDVPTGFKHNTVDSSCPALENMECTLKMVEIFGKNGLKQLGSLGGGNHFIEIGYDESDAVWIIIHSGSRGIGHAMATHYMKLASGDGKARDGHFGFDVNSQNGMDYIKDLNFCTHFALANRVEMINRIDAVMERYCGNRGDIEDLINRNHNHAELRDGLWIHRKGATHADEGMFGVIPGNMRDGSFIVKGLGNPDSLWSSSHGAGRVLSRTKAENTLSLDTFKETMTGITSNVTNKTLDESPMAYKNIFDVMKLQSELVEVVAHVTPIINIKG